jgi:hypothetical protein
MQFPQDHNFQFLGIRYINSIFVQECSIHFQFIVFHFLYHLTVLYIFYQFHVLQIDICNFQNLSFNISLIHVNGRSMYFMYSPAECINHFVLLSFDMLDIKVILTKEFQPSTLPSQGWLIKQILQTIMVCPHFELPSHEVVPPFISSVHYGCQPQIKSDIVLFMLFQFCRFITYDKSIMVEDSSWSLFACICTHYKIFIQICNP